MTERPEIHGTCDPRYERVLRAFEENFRAAPGTPRHEIGAALAVTVDGETVVDLWAGSADPAAAEGGGRPWQKDTLVNVYSTTKGVTALCAHRLAEEGRLDLDAPVARYWPEFAQAGKQDVPVRWLLSHRAALPAVREILPAEALYDWDAMCSALAAEEPWWTPGEQHGYHALTYGWLVGEVVRRVDGRSLGTYFREEIAEPLGLDFHIGLPEGEHARCADMGPMAMPDPTVEGANLAQALLTDPEGMLARAFMNPPSMAAGPNVPAWRSAEIPGANGHGTALALARLYGALACGGRLEGVHVLGPEAVATASTEQSHGDDAVLKLRTRIGLGFMLSQDRPGAAFGPGARGFGHPGAGGSVGFADPDARVGFGYVMNRMGPHILLDPRATALIDALYAS
ncbi:MAG: serine hydrolase domain-containing protein [Myxococcota bacterium]